LLLGSLFVALGGFACGIGLALLVLGAGLLQVPPLPSAATLARSLFPAGLAAPVDLPPPSQESNLPANGIAQRRDGAGVQDTPVDAFNANLRSSLTMSQQSPAPLGAENALLNPDWSAPENLSASPGRAADPLVLAGSGGDLHVVWMENGRIYHRARQDDQWTPAISVASGQQAAASLSTDGTVHLVFSHEFFGQVNVFYVKWQAGTWSLPILVSKTSGFSTYPAIAVGPAGLVHAAWSDLTPGFSIIYHGWLEETWLNEPLHNARGTMPALVSDPIQHSLHLAYEATGIGNSPAEIYHLQGGTYQWSLPENVSLSPATESQAAAMASDSQGRTHLVWQEESDGMAYVAHASGSMGNWSPPLRLSAAGIDAREPAVLVTHGTQLSVVWREGDAIRYRRWSGTANTWHEASSLISNPNELDGPALAGAPNGELHLVWSGWSSSNERDIFHSRRNPLLEPRIYLPGVDIGGL
jgi:hypothetical protein